MSALDNQINLLLDRQINDITNGAVVSLVEANNMGSIEDYSEEDFVEYALQGLADGSIAPMTDAEFMAYMHEPDSAELDGFFKKLKKKFKKSSMFNPKALMNSIKKRKGKIKSALKKAAAIGVVAAGAYFAGPYIMKGASFLKTKGALLYKYAKRKAQSKMTSDPAKAARLEAQAAQFREAAFLRAKAAQTGNPEYAVQADAIGSPPAVDSEFMTRNATALAADNLRDQYGMNFESPQAQQVLDTAVRAEQQRVAYDIGRDPEGAIAAGMPPEEAERLARGEKKGGLAVPLIAAGAAALTLVK
jgi:hypothetical protein